MDERIFLYKVGHPIPEWDLQHRLPIDKDTGPECRDDGTIFRINSTYMDVTDQSYTNRQWTAWAVLTAVIGMLMMIYLTVKIYIIRMAENFDLSYAFVYIYIFFIFSMFYYISIRIGRDEFFSLKRRPIRFNRKEKKIYTIRRRRFSGYLAAGDITWEVPWDETSIFCIHKGVGSYGNPYHIRHYTVDADGNVLQAFAIGREWNGKENFEGLLSQWNYWCWYMNHGPDDLPLPPIFYSEHESTLETFLFCMYDFGLRASSASRIRAMPMILFMTLIRLLAQWTCRDPIWPPTVEQVSAIDPDDPYNQPSGNTPVGWADTARAHERHDYPYDPKRKSYDWHGEQDGARNAFLWAQDIPPAIQLPPTRPYMKDAKGRGAIRIGDGTTHGGKVTEGSDTLKALGKHVALDGHMTWCPKCKGTFPILAPDSTNKHNGKNIAYDGDPTSCGAKLISSI